MKILSSIHIIYECYFYKVQNNSLIKSRLESFDKPHFAQSYEICIENFILISKQEEGP